MARRRVRQGRRRLGAVLAGVSLSSGLVLAPLVPASPVEAAPPTVISVVRVNDSSNPGIADAQSGDGRWTFFEQGGYIWAYDALGAPFNKVLISQTTGGTPFNSASSRSSAADMTGRFLAFTGYVDLFAPAVWAPGTSTYLRDRDTDEDGIFDEPGAASTIQIGTRLTNTSTEASISADGRYVAFLQPDVSATVNPAQGNRCLRAYRYDRITGVVIDLTLTNSGIAPPCDPSDVSSLRMVYRVFLSGDGQSAALGVLGWQELTAPTVTAARHVVVRDVATAATEMLAFDGTTGNGNVQLQAFSADGRYVLGWGEHNNSALRLDRGSALLNPDVTQTVSAVAFPFTMSRDGRAIVLVTSTDRVLWRSSGTVTLISGVGSNHASINSDGSVVTLSSVDPPPGVTGNGFTDLYRFEVASSATYTVDAGLALEAPTTPPAATEIHIADIPTEVVRRSNLALAAAPLGGKSVAPIGGTSAAPLGGKGAAPLGGKGAAPLGGKGAAPLGGKGAAPLGGKGVAAFDGLSAVRNLPLAMMPVDGGWTTRLASTDLAGRPVQTLTVGQVIDLAPSALEAVRVDLLDFRRTVLADATPAAWALGTIAVRTLVYAGGQSFCTVLHSAQAAPPAMTPDQFCDASGITPTTTMFQIDLDPTKAGVVATAPVLHSPPIRPNLAALTSGMGAPLLDLPLPALGLGISRVGDISLVDLVAASAPVAALALDEVGVAGNVVHCTLVNCEPETPDTLGTAYTARALRTEATLRSISVELAALDLADVAMSLADDVDFDDILIGTLEADQFPWEDLDLVASGVQEFAPTPTTVGLSVPLTVCALDALECLDPVSGTVTLTLPPSFRMLPGSATIGGGASIGAVTSKFTGTATVVTIGVSGIQPGVAATLDVDLLPGFTLGSHTISATVKLAGITATPPPVQIQVTEPTDVPGTVATNTFAESDTLHVSYIATPDDVDLFRVPAATGKIVSVWVSHFERDADVVLYGPATVSASDRAPRANTPVLDFVPDDGADGGATAPPAGSETSHDLPEQPGLTPVATSATGVDGGTERATALGADLVQISAFNGVTSVKPYVLRIRTDQTVVPAECVYTPAYAYSSGVAAGSFTIPGGTLETLVLTAPTRFGQRYGATAVDDVDAKIAALLASPGVQGAAIDVAADASVATALNGWNAAWCDPEAANHVVRALTGLIARIHAAHPELRHVVLVGGDEILPMARLADTTRLANEDSYAEEVPAGPLREALRTRHYLSDDPYGDLDPISFLDRQIYVPDVAVGRLVEDPAEIAASIDAFVNSAGRLEPASAYVSGNDFMSDGATMAADRLEDAYVSAGGPAGQQATRLIGETWTKAQLITGLTNATTSGLYSHFGYDRGISAYGFNRDRTINFEAGPDSFSPSDVAAALQPVGSAPTTRLLFSMGCHAGLSVAGASDFAQAIVGTGAMFVGVTTYGFGNTVGAALDERLLASFAGNLDGQVITGVGPMSVGEALVQAKQDYWSGQGLYGPYDEKVLQSTVFYGLPMYHVEPTTGPIANPPTRQAAPPLAPGSVVGATYQVASMTVNSTFSTVTNPDGTQYVMANGLEPLMIANRPVQPRAVDEITASDGTNLLPAHGALITDLDSATSLSNFVATFPRPTAVDSELEPSAVPTDVAFPTSLVSITTASDPVGQPQAQGGPRQRQYLVTIPGRFRSGTVPGVGTQDLFGSIDIDVLYSTSSDFAPPTISSARGVVDAGGVSFTIDTSDQGVGGVQRVLVLYRTASGWQPLDLIGPVVPGGPWTGEVVGALPVALEYLVQSVDASGNIATAAGKGRGVGEYVPPTLGDAVASVGDVAFAEGSGGGVTPASAVITLDRPAPAGGLEFGYALTSGTASVGSDVTQPFSSVTVGEGLMSVAVPFNLVADDATEGDESFGLTITPPGSGVVLSGASSTVTIVDDEAPIAPTEPTVSIGASASGNEGSVITVPIYLDIASVGPVTVTWQAVEIERDPQAHGEATAVVDFPTSGQTIIPAGTACPVGGTCAIEIATIESDDLDADDEDFKVVVTGATGAAVDGGADEAMVTIHEDDDRALLSITGATTVQEAAGQLELTVSLDQAIVADVVVDVSLYPDLSPGAVSATIGTDVSTPPGYTVTIPAGQTGVTATIDIDNDGLVEGDETFAVNVAAQSTTPNFQFDNGPAHYVTISGSVLTPVVSIQPTATVDESAGSVEVDVTLDSPAALTGVTVSYQTVAGTATSPGDLADSSGTITFETGETSKTIVVDVVNDDTSVEGDETFTIQISDPVGADLGTATSVVTITDDDLVTLTLEAAQVVEGTADEGRTPFEVTVVLDRTVEVAAAFTWSLDAGSALIGSDLDAAGGSFTIPQGVTSFGLPIAVVPDFIIEADEEATVNLEGFTGPVTNTALEASLTIVDDDLVHVTVGSPTVLEQSGPVSVSAVLSYPHPFPISIPYSTQNGTALAGSDYTATSGTLVFAPNTTTATIVVPIINDGAGEGTTPQQFSVVLAPADAAIVTVPGVVSIVDDESLYLSVGDSFQVEGDTTVRFMVFTVTLNRRAPTAVTLAWGANEGTASLADLSATGGTVNIPRGSRTATVRVPLAPDAIVEGNEAFSLSISANRAGVLTPSVTGLIIDDDAVSVSVGDASRVESDWTTRSMTFTISLSGPRGESVAVPWSTVALGTATAGTDYYSASGTVVFNPGQTTKTVKVSIRGDRIREDDETFALWVNHPTLGFYAAVGTIIDND